MCVEKKMSVSQVIPSAIFLTLLVFIHLSDNVNMTTEITLHMC